MSTKAAISTTPWGIYDPADKCWMGHDNGPLLYTDREINGQRLTGETLARAAATILNEKYPRRFRAKLYNENADRLKDVITL